MPNEIRTKNIEMIRPAVMPEVPDDLGSGLSGGADDRLYAGEIELVRHRFNQVPAQPFTHRANAMLLKQAIIFGGEAIVLRRGDEVEPTTVSSAGASSTRIRR